MSENLLNGGELLSPKERKAYARFVLGVATSEECYRKGCPKISECIAPGFKLAARQKLTPEAAEEILSNVQNLAANCAGEPHEEVWSSRYGDLESRVVCMSHARGHGHNEGFRDDGEDSPDDDTDPSLVPVG